MKPRILVWGMTNNRAGTEKVISNIVATTNELIDFDFLTFEAIGAWPELLIDNNRQFIIPNKRTSYGAYKKTLSDFFEEHASEYAASWSNINIPNNVDALLLSQKHGIPVRIAHAHNSANDGNFHQKVLSFLNRNKPYDCSTTRWACTREAGNYLFRNKDFCVIPNAIDTEAVSFSPSKRSAIRKQYEIYEDAPLIGTVGRLSHQKNPVFLLQTFIELAKQRPDARLMFVGEGELKDALEREAQRSGISDKVIFTGRQTDIQGYLSAFDAFALPSHFEGMSLSLIEAQSNGLPIIASSNIIDESVFNEEQVKRIPLSHPNEWTKALAASCRIPRIDNPIIPNEFTMSGFKDLLIEELASAGVQVAR